MGQPNALKVVSRELAPGSPPLAVDLRPGASDYPYRSYGRGFYQTHTLSFAVRVPMGTRLSRSGYVIVAETAPARRQVLPGKSSEVRTVRPHGQGSTRPQRQGQLIPVLLEPEGETESSSTAPGQRRAAGGRHSPCHRRGSPTDRTISRSMRTGPWSKRLLASNWAAEA